MTNSIEDDIPIKLKTLAARTISGCLEVRVGGKYIHIGTLDPTSDIVWCKVKNMMLN